MNQLRIVFDGTYQVQESPEGWQDVTSSIDFIDEVDGRMEVHEATLTFKEDGYDYLMNVYDSVGHCAEIRCELSQLCDSAQERFCDGIIKLSDITIDRWNCTITVKVIDNSYYAKIQNNKSVDAYLWAGRSKNDIPIDVCPLSPISFFEPATGTYTAVPTYDFYESRGYRIDDVFRYLIDFMTDGTIDYESSLFGVGGDFENLSITIGRVIRTITDMSGLTEAQFKESFPAFNFGDVFTEVKRKLNIGMYIDYSQYRPRVRIEYVQDLNTNSVSHTDYSLSNLKEIVAPDKNYSKLRIGSDEISDALFVQWPEDARGIAWKDETFIILNNCNIDRELNLVNSWIISGGIIEDCFTQNNPDFDENVFLIDVDASFNAVQTKTDEANVGAPYYYNNRLTNIEVIENYLGAIPSSVAQYLGNADNTFRASEPNRNPSAGFYDPVFPTYVLEGVFPFTDETTSPNFDTGGNYDNVNSEYECPDSGLYTFRVHDLYMELIKKSGAFMQADIEVRLDRYDNLGFGGGNLIQRHVIYTQTINSSIPAITLLIDRTKSIIVNQTDRVLVSWYVRTTSSFPLKFYFRPDGVFECTNHITGGGIYAEFNPNDYMIINHQFDAPLSVDEYSLISQNPTYYIGFGIPERKKYSGWIKSLRYRRFDGTASFVTYNSKSNLK